MLAARLALLIAAAGLTDGLLIRPALRQQHALVAASAQRSVPGGATMGLLPSFLTDAQGKVDAQRVKSAARVHDYFNIVATSVMSGMVIAARFKGGAVWDLRLAFVMGGYLLLDSFFIGLLPEIVAADGDGASGGVATLLAHHFAAIGVSWHAATWAPHTMHAQLVMQPTPGGFGQLALRRRLSAPGRASGGCPKLRSASASCQTRVFWLTRHIWYHTGLGSDHVCTRQTQTQAAQVVSRTDTHLPATHRYTSYMAVVEINTLFLMLKSHVPGKRVKAALDTI